MKRYNMFDDGIHDVEISTEGEYVKFVDVQYEIKRLRDALDAWITYDKESIDYTPCPDYALAKSLRGKARRPTKAALAGKE